MSIQLPSDANSTGRSFGPEERALLEQVLESGTLNCTKGTVVKEMECGIAGALSLSYCYATTSGTSAIHTAVAAIDPEPGDEIISSPITDMGAISPILYQTAIPVFADVDPHSLNITAETIAPKITRRTRAVIVTHLFGACCDMDPILELCGKHDIPVIEDCAQAYLATDKGRLAGTMGDIGCFSLQQGKHITSGEGGFVVSNDKKLARRMRLFIDKAWGYGDSNPDHYFLAPNYRMTELQGAVALAQFRKLPEMLEVRLRAAGRLTEKVNEIEGVHGPEVPDGCKHVYWRYALRIDPAIIKGSADDFGAGLKEAGIFCAPRYIQKPAFECQVLRDHVTFGKSQFPYVGAHREGDEPVVYDRKDTPGTVEGLDNVVVIPLNEKYTDEHIDYIAEKIKEVAGKLS